MNFHGDFTPSLNSKDSGDLEGLSGCGAGERKEIFSGGGVFKEDEESSDGEVECGCFGDGDCLDGVDFCGGSGLSSSRERVAGDPMVDTGSDVVESNADEVVDEEEAGRRLA